MTYIICVYVCEHIHTNSLPAGGPRLLTTTTKQKKKHHGTKDICGDGGPRDSKREREIDSERAETIGQYIVHGI